MDYKVEWKPTLWEVILSEGHYSDYNEHHLFFQANSEEEVWHFLKRYLKATYHPGSRPKYGSVSTCVVGKVSWGGEVYEVEGNDWNTYDVSIEPLNVIIFKN